MDTRQLEYIVTIAEEGSLSRAAEKLYITQSALSQMLSKLKDSGLPPLFEENRHRMVLTDAGKIYLNGARTILLLEKQAAKELKEIQKNQLMHFHIAVAMYWQRKMLLRVLPDLQKKFPDVRFSFTHLDSENTRKDLLDGTLDLAIVPESTQLDYMNYAELGKDELVFVLSRTAFSPEELENFRTPEDLKNIPAILPTNKTYLRYLCDRLLSSIQMMPDVLAELGNLRTVRNVIDTQQCFALLPRSCADETKQKILSASDPANFSIDAVYPKSMHEKMAEVVIQIIRKSLKIR